MSEPQVTPTTKEDRAATEQRRADQRAAKLRALETDVLSLTTRTASEGGLGWAEIADALERMTAAARALAGGKK